MKHSLSTLILTAGHSSRLGLYGKAVPKAFIPINGIPLIYHWLEKLECIKDRLPTHFNVWDHRDISLAFAKRMNNEGADILFELEDELLGSAGTLMALRRKYKDDLGDHILVIYGDNWSEIHLGHMLDKHIRCGADITMAVNREEIGAQRSEKTNRAKVD